MSASLKLADRTVRLKQLMHDQGYRLREASDRGHGPTKHFYDANDQYVCFPPGYCTYQEPWTQGVKSVCQLSVKNADGSWSQWVVVNLPSEADYERVLQRQTEEILRCVNDPPEDEQMQPLVQLVGLHAREILGADYVPLP